MESPFNIESELRLEGLSPKSWPEVFETIKSKVTTEDWAKFTRLHKNFIGYRSETTLARFYGFIFTRGLHKELNCYRFNRLTHILADLSLEMQPGQSVLDVGAGAGIIAAILTRKFAPKKYVVQDFCAEAQGELQAQGFSVLGDRQTQAGTNEDSRDYKFDLILCIDSLGEINGDEDDILSTPASIERIDFPSLLEERYGFAQKLSLWKSYLKPEGRVLVWEPFAYPSAMAGLKVLLQDNGWQAGLISRTPNRNYLELRLA